MQLPQDLQSAMERLLEDRNDTQGRDAARAVSERYRDKRRNSAEQMVSTTAAAAAYTATRMPATWAAIRSAMEQVAALCRHWHPHTLLDVGAGTGAAAWAAVSVWPDLSRATLAERSEVMSSMGKALAEHASHEAIRQAHWVMSDLSGEVPPGRSDLVTAAFVLNELGDAALEEAVGRLWDATGDMLIVVEPGTPDAWQRMMRIRSQLLHCGAHLVGPCPHERPCPIVAPDWCHFSERVNRLRIHRQLKNAQLAYEDEKFTWLAFSRHAVEPAKARVLRHPEVHSGWIRLSLCAVGGLETKTVSRRESMAWKRVRDIAMGDAWEDDGTEVRADG